MNSLQRVLDFSRVAGWTCSGFGLGFLQRILAYCVAVGGMYSGFVAPLNVPHDHFYLDGDSPPAAAFQHSISEVQSFLGHSPLGNRCAPAGRIHPPAPKVRLSMSRTELDMLVQMERRDSATLPIPQSGCVSFEQPVRALAKCCRRA